MNTALKAVPAPGDKKTPEDASVQMLLEEIDSEVKAAQLGKFFEAYGKYVAAGILAVIIGTAGTSMWMNARTQRQENDSAMLGALMDKDVEGMPDNDAKNLLQAYAEFEHNAASDGHKTIARFAEASVLIKKGETDAAIAGLNALREDGAVPPIYRDYALLLSLRLRMDHDDPQKVLDALKPLLAPGNDWQMSASEMAALLYAKMGQKDQALTYLKTIIDTPGVPVPVRERALQLQHLYSAQ